MKLTTNELYNEITSTIPAEHIDHWCGDLYVKMTKETKNIIDRYEYKNSVLVFMDQITGAPWYEIPFAYIGENWRAK